MQFSSRSRKNSEPPPISSSQYSLPQIRSLWPVALLAGLSFPAEWSAVRAQEALPNLKSLNPESPAKPGGVKTAAEIRTEAFDDMHSAAHGSYSVAKNIEALIPKFKEFIDQLQKTPALNLTEIQAIYEGMNDSLDSIVYGFTTTHEAVGNFRAGHFYKLHKLLLDACQRYTPANKEEVVEKKSLLEKLRCDIFYGTYSASVDEKVWTAAVKVQSDFAVKNQDYESFSKLKEMLDMPVCADWFFRRLLIKDHEKLLALSKGLERGLNDKTIAYDSQEVRDYVKILTVCYRFTIIPDDHEMKKDPTLERMRAIVKEDLTLPLLKHLPLIFSQGLVSEDQINFYSQYDFLEPSETMDLTIDAVHLVYGVDNDVGKLYLNEVKEYLAASSLDDVTRTGLYSQLLQLSAVPALQAEILDLTIEGISHEKSRTVMSTGVAPLYVSFFFRYFPDDQVRAEPQNVNAVTLLCRDILAPIFVPMGPCDLNTVRNMYLSPGTFDSMRWQIPYSHSRIAAVIQNALYDYNLEDFRSGKPEDAGHTVDPQLLRRNTSICLSAICRNMLPQVNSAEELESIPSLTRWNYAVPITRVYVPTWAEYQLRARLLATFETSMLEMYGEGTSVEYQVDNLLSTLQIVDSRSLSFARSNEGLDKAIETLSPWYGRIDRSENAGPNYFSATYQNTRAALYSKEHGNVPDLGNSFEEGQESTSSYDQSIDQLALRLASAQREYTVSQVFTTLIFSPDIQLSFTSRSGAAYRFEVAKDLADKLHMLEDSVPLCGDLSDTSLKGQIIGLEQEVSNNPRAVLDWRDKAKLKYEKYYLEYYERMTKE